MGLWERDVLYSVEDLRRIALHGTNADKRHVALDPLCPVDLLVEWEQSPYGELWSVAYAHPRLPENIVWRRIRAWREKTTPREGWTTLKRELRIELKAILQRPGLTPQMLKTLGEPECLAHPNVPVDRMHAVAFGGDTCMDELVFLASNPNLPQTIQTHFAKDSRTILRKKLAGNCGITEETVGIMKDDESPRVLRKLIRQANAERYRAEIAASLAGRPLGRESVQLLSRYSDDPVLVAELYDFCKQRAELFEYVFSNDALDDERVKQGCYSDDITLRSLAVKHPKAAEEDQVVAALLGVR